MVEILLVPNERTARVEGYLFYPSRDNLPLEDVSLSPEVKKKRVEILWKLLKGEDLKIVTTLKALTERIFSPEFLERNSIKVRRLSSFDLTPERFVEAGYERVFTVQMPGEFSIRGGILDIFSPGYDFPVRIELFGDEVEDIRFFDITTQRSFRGVDEVYILPFLDEYGNSSLIDFVKNARFTCEDLEKVLEEYRKIRREMKDLLKERYAQFFDESVLDRVLKNIEKTSSVVSTPSRKEEEVLPLVDVDEIEEGELVVHKEHGIAIFEGMVRLRSVLGERDYLKLRYEDAVLYVPVEKIDRVHRYIGDPTQVKLDRLSKGRWKRTLRKVREDIEKRVRELVELYLQREEARGIPLSGDPELEEKFAETFPYIETPDQQRCIEEVLADLSSEKPMDRLLCGDAGVGKTEVALRAAFRAVVSGKQVAVLVPTTVLARQHYENFKERLDSFGVKVELLDSSRTLRERKKILEGLKKGEVDIVIGTHALLNNRVEFSDLGLVIIDEEQKFGVEQKEKFKKMRLSVNVLSLSATPIPRTLHMALSGMKDFSVINVPPPGRGPVYVSITEYSEELVKGAIVREINRGGQVIYVHNRVDELPEVFEKLKKMFPEFRIAMAHGKMSRRTMEKIVHEFYSGSVDILLCTTIIENGVDIPNANTLIVDDAHRYGLAQLYQLRGRVGRSNRRAFAYFLYPKGVPRSALERLKVLKTHTGPGSGLQIAMRDMEMRGIGDVLGLEQHGNIVSIGLKLYNEILKETVMRVKRKQVEEKRVISVEIENPPGKFFIPEGYISNLMERLRIYRRLASFTEEEGIEEILEEMKDRFGEPPEEVKLLLDYFKMRIRASKLGVRKIKFDHSMVELFPSKDSPLLKHPGYNPRSGTVVLYKRGDPIEYLLRVLKNE
ncbi:transcription-repair coupling factor [Thermotoga sp.]|uniref:transcription-repair coupling factor n=1 Tax=Thermotoga sp. TaxID=28240 RepID=UPI0025F96ECF|nr:transcription-repair coupling factor [Thermotoga sp.]MCD6551725.1 transcription-repair coupling factor [Thermotoga sp.]